MRSCLLCPSPATIGVLCVQHGVEIASPGITSEQIVARSTSGRAALIDAFGYAHAVEDRTTIGRDPGALVAVAHPSVSSRHATITFADRTWNIADAQSRNGTEVDNQRIIADCNLVAGVKIKLGNVGFYFWPEPITNVERLSGKGRTAPTRRDEIAFVATILTPRGHQVDLRQRIDGGVLRAGGKTLELAAMEFGLLQLLIARRRLVADREHAYLAWHEIADALSFRSVLADSENVRELVHRVRRKLKTVEADDVIESLRGTGYRVACEFE